MGFVDADAHVIETSQTWSYLEPADKKFEPLLVTQVAGPEVTGNEGRKAVEYWIMDNRTHARDKNVGSDTSVESREMRDVAARLAHMDQLGIDVQVLYPTLFLRPALRTAAAELALVKSYNRWLAAINAYAPSRMRWVAMPPLLSMDKVRDELKFCKDHGACGIFMRGLEWDKTVADPYFFPLYEIATELDLCVCFHSGSNSIVHHDFFTEDTTFTKFKLAVVGAFHSLIEKNVPGVFPDVRWGFIEVGAQWVPYACHDLRYRLARQKRTIPNNFLAANNMFVACQVTDDLPYIMNYAGEDALVLGTDYGHHDPSAEINAFTLIANRGDIPVSARRKIASDNPRRLYGL